MASSFCRLGTKWPRILSPWDKLGGVVRDWRRFGVTGSGCWRIVVCRSGIKRLLILSPWDKMASHFVALGQNGLLILSPWDKMASHFVALGQTGWRCSGLEAVRRHRIRLWRIVVCRSGIKRLLILSPWDNLASPFVLLGQTGWDCSGLEAVRRYRIRLFEARSLSLWDKIGLLFGRLGTKWPLLLSSWDKLGGIVRDWRRFGVTGSLEIIG